MTDVLHYDRRIPDLSHLHHQISEPLLDPDVADSDSLPDPDVADSESLPNYSDVTAADVVAVIVAVVAFITIVSIVAIVVVIEILKYYLKLILFKN
ncbi:hypothetical protein RCL_jg24110.t1 [Rhizophagus clarus]|uniref:Uncharacterized protein n=1 Tax=Rhizophagus clarus TaxID=94130 RepID=A0A8H3LAB8_9GLOM|nr:hypothetical protein RCL_jg24110.t1 [Rhizophagus clarus]